MISNRIKNLKLFYPIQKWEKNEILRKKSEIITTFDEELFEFAEVLNELMFEYDGVWLAAPQIGKNIRMISISIRNLWKKSISLKKSEIMINPEIIYASKEKEIDAEWCISLPGMECKVLRSKDIKVRYRDITWKEKIISAKWFNARIILHEMDHLEWILMSDRAESRKNKNNLKNLINDF